MPNKPKPKAAGPVPTSAPTNTLRMDGAALERFLSARDAAEGREEASLKRGFVRWPFRNTSVGLTVLHPGGSQAKFNVACRNLSSAGVGVLHSAYIHPGAACVIELPDNQGRSQTIEGVVVRCCHVQGTIHEVGIKLSTPIDTRQFLNIDPFSDGFSLESVNPDDLRGVVLFIGRTALDQAMVRHFLRETQVELITASTAEEGLEKALNGVDLVLCDSNPEQDDGPEIVRRLREASVSQPIIMLTADTSTQHRARLSQAEADAFITKPLKQTTLFRALGEFMMLNTGSAGMSSTLPANHPNLGLIETFVGEMREYGRQIDVAMGANDMSKIRGLCLQIRGSAPVMGFERLAELAVAAEKALGRAKTCAEAAVALRSLVSACQRLSARMAA